MFHSSLELDDKHGGAVKVMNEKLSLAETKLSKLADRIKELETEKKILEREKAELVSRCQRYDENAQQHRNEIEKMQLAHIQKTEMKVIDMDTSNLKKQKATQSQLDDGRARVAALSNIITSNRNVTPTSFGALVHPQQHDPSATARTDALQTIAPHYGVQQPHQQQYTNPIHPVVYNVGGGGTQQQLQQQQPFVQQQQQPFVQQQQQFYPPNHTILCRRTETMSEGSCRHLISSSILSILCSQLYTTLEVVAHSSNCSRHHSITRSGVYSMMEVVALALLVGFVYYTFEYCSICSTHPHPII